MVRGPDSRGWNPYSWLTLLLQRVYRTGSLPWSAQRRTSLRHDCQPYRRAHLSRPLSLLLQHSPTLWQLPRRPHLSTGTTSQPAATARRRHWWHRTHLLASASFSSTRLYSDIFWDFLVCVTMPPRTYPFSTQVYQHCWRNVEKLPFGKRTIQQQTWTIWKLKFILEENKISIFEFTDRSSLETIKDTKTFERFVMMAI